jgi:iron complex transport system substrate-binding protein
MNNLRNVLLAIFLSTVLAAGCSPETVSTPAPTMTAAPPSPTVSPTALQPIRLTDGLGTEITLDEPAARIVSLGASNTEILYAIGADDLLLGCDQFSDYPEPAQALAVISAGYGTLDVETITSLAPDLVLAAEIISAEQVQAMRSLGLTVFYIANPDSLPDGLYANMHTIGELSGRRSGAEKAVAGLQGRFQAVAERVAGTTSRPLVYVELDGSDPARPYTAGAGSFIDMLVGLAGGRNLGASLSSEWAQISAEEIFRADPDIILLGDTAFGVTVESVADRPGWQNLSAVQQNAVYAVDSDLVLRPGPRMIDGLEFIAAILHPETAAGEGGHHPNR